MMAGASEERSRKPTLRSIAAVVIILLAGLVGTAIVYRQSIAETLLMRQLHSLGLDQAAFSVSRFDAGLLELENLSIGNGDGLEIAQIEAHFSTRGLFASRLDALQISGVRLRGTLDEAGLSFGSLDRLFEESTTSANTSGPAVLPASGIEIEDALLEIATAEGPLRANLELRAVEVAPGQLEAEAELQVDHALAGLGARLSAMGSPDALTGELELEASAAGEFGSDISASAISLAAKAAFSFEEGGIAIQPEGCAELRIEGLSVGSALTLSTPLDLCLRSRSESSIRISKDGAIETDLEVAPAGFAADLQIGREPQRVSGELPTLRISASRRDDGFEASLETEAGRLEFAKQAVGLRDISLEANVSDRAAFSIGSLRIGEIFDTQQVARFQNLALNAQFEPHEDGVGFEMELASPNRELVIESSGTHALADATGRARFHVHAIEFSPGQLQPSTLFPALSDLLTEASGSIEMKGVVEWGADGMRGAAEVAVTDVSATSELATVEHLNATIELNETGATPLNQTISVGRLNVGLELTEGLIRYRVKPGWNVEIESTSWKFAGGELTTVGKIDPRAENRKSSIHVENVDLAEFIKLVNLEGLSGSGKLEGEFPIVLGGGEIEIRNAVLRSNGEAGVIRYRPDPGTANIAAADDQFATTLKVLENFHYERLEIEINGPALGEVAIQIHLAGVNPDYKDGYPVDFNLSVDSRLSDLLRTGIRIYRLPEEIEKRLGIFAERAR
jgi:hypothetical protein